MMKRTKRYLYRRLRTSFAKSGEDIQLWQILGMPSSGIYADIGSHHPIRGSNSFFFHLRGWTGICVDPNPRLAPLYRKLRPGDVFINEGVSDRPGELTYYQFAESQSARNTFSEEYLASVRDRLPVAGSITVPVTTLKNIFEQFLDARSPIDFLSIDCEGMDEAVLKGNDWKKYRPRVVCVETHHALAQDLTSPLATFMEANGYDLAGKSVLGPDVGSLFFLRQEAPR